MAPYLLRVLEFGPATLEKLVAQISPDRYDEALAEDRFTLREVIAHMADSEPIFRARIEAVIANPGMTITPFDPDDRALSADFAHMDVKATLQLFIEERAATAKLVRALPREAFSTPYRHPEMGDLKVEDQVGMLVFHDLYHVEQVAAYLS